MDKRTIVKHVAKFAVAVGVGNVVTKALVANVPSTENYKVAEIAGMTAGAVVMTQFEADIDAAVDAWFDAREAKKTH